MLSFVDRLAIRRSWLLDVFASVGFPSEVQLCPEGAVGGDAMVLSATREQSSAVAPAALEPKVKKVMVEIVPRGGTYNVYRKGRFLQRTGPDLSPLSIAATERKPLPAEYKTKNVDFAPLRSEARTKAGIYVLGR